MPFLRAFRESEMQTSSSQNWTYYPLHKAHHLLKHTVRMKCNSLRNWFASKIGIWDPAWVWIRTNSDDKKCATISTTKSAKIFFADFLPLCIFCIDSNNQSSNPDKSQHFRLALHNLFNNSSTNVFTFCSLLNLSRILIIFMNPFSF